MKYNIISIGILITIANIVGKVLGFVKDIQISFYYGSTWITDGFFMAMSIPFMVLGIFTSATDSVIIPQYNRISVNFGRKTADAFFSKVLLALFAIGLVMSLLLLLFPEALVALIAPGFSGALFKYTIDTLRLFSFLGFFHIFYCFLCTYNTIYKQIGMRAILSFSTNLIIVFTLIFIHDSKMYGLIMAQLCGSFISMLLPAYGAYKLGYTPFVKTDIPAGEMRQFLKIFLPIMTAALLSEINIFVDKFLASKLPAGGVSALNYAFKLPSIFDNLIVVGLGIVVLFSLSESYREKNYDSFKKQTTNIIKFMIVLLTPVAIFFMLMSHQLIEIIYMRGKFDTTSVILVSRVLKGYAPVVLLAPLFAAFSRIFHSTEDTRTPLAIFTCTVAINVALSIILANRYGVSGISTATSISLLCACMISIFIIKKRIGFDRDNLCYIDIGKILVCNILFALSLFSAIRLTIDSYWQIIYAALVGGITYLVSVLFMLRNEFKNFITYLRKK